MFYYPFTEHTHIHTQCIYINTPFGREGVSHPSIHPSRSQTTVSYTVKQILGCVASSYKMLAWTLAKGNECRTDREGVEREGGGLPRTLTPAAGASKDGKHAHTSILQDAVRLCLCVCAMWAIRKRKLLRLEGRKTLRLNPIFKNCTHFQWVKFIDVFLVFPFDQVSH